MRIADAQHDQADTHRREGRQRSGIGQRGQLVQPHDAGEARHHDGGEDGHHRRYAARGHPGQTTRQQAVAGHAEEDAALAEQEGQQHCRQGDHGRDRNPLRRRVLPHLAQDQSQRFGAFGKAGHRTGPDRGGGHHQIKGRADDHGADDADGQITLGPLGLLGGRRDGVEAVEGEEDDRRRRHDPGLDHGLAGDLLRERQGGRSEAVGHEGGEVGGVEGRQGDGHKGDQGHDLDDHEDGVQRRTLAGAQQQQAGHHGDDEDGRQIDQPALDVRSRRKNGRQLNAHPGEEADGIARPADRHGRDHQRILEDQAPADDPGDQLAQHGVGIGIGTARRRHHGRELGIGQGGAGADQSREGEADHHRRTGQAGADPDQGQDAGADDRPDAERHQMRPAQRLLQRRPVMRGQHGVDRAPAVPEGHGRFPRRRSPAADSRDPSPSCDKPKRTRKSPCARESFPLGPPSPKPVSDRRRAERHKPCLAYARRMVRVISSVGRAADS